MSEDDPIVGSFVIPQIANCSDFSHNLYGTIRDVRNGTFRLETVADGKAHIGILVRRNGSIEVDFPSLDHKVGYAVKLGHSSEIFLERSRHGGAEFYFTRNT